MFQHSIGLCILLACSAPAVAGPDRTLFENPYALDAERSCGPLCVGFINRYFGGTLHYNEIASLCQPGTLGINLASAESALQKLGYHTRTVRLRAESLKSLRWPCILHEERGDGLGHFVVCVRWQPEHRTFQIYDPPMTLEELKVEAVKERMGTALAIVVSQTPLPPAHELVPAEWSWQSMLGIEALLIGVLLLVFGRTSAKKRPSECARVAALILAIVLPLGGCHHATPTGPQVSEDGRTIDLGKVQQGTDLKATFRVRNQSKSSFRIERVERSCRCQDVVFDSQHEVPPEGETTVSVVVPTKKDVGPVQQRFIVHTTATDQAHAAIDLLIKADMHAPLRAIPSELMIGPDSGTGAARQLRIETDPPELVSKYLSIEAPGFIEVKLLNQDHSGLLFTVQRTAQAPKGTFNGIISVRFDDAEFPELNVPVMSQKTGPIRVIPAKLMVNGLGDEQTLKVLIASTNGQTFRLLSASTPEGATPVWDDAKDAQERHLVRVVFTSPEAVD